MEMENILMAIAVLQLALLLVQIAALKNLMWIKHHSANNYMALSLMDGKVGHWLELENPDDPYRHPDVWVYGGRHAT